MSSNDEREIFDWATIAFYIIGGAILLYGVRTALIFIRDLNEDSFSVDISGDGYLFYGIVILIPIAIYALYYLGNGAWMAIKGSVAYLNEATR